MCRNGVSVTPLNPPHNSKHTSHHTATHRQIATTLYIYTHRYCSHNTGWLLTPPASHPVHHAPSAAHPITIILSGPLDDVAGTKAHSTKHLAQSTSITSRPAASSPTPQRLVFPTHPHLFQNIFIYRVSGAWAKRSPARTINIPLSLCRLAQPNTKTIGLS